MIRIKIGKLAYLDSFLRNLTKLHIDIKESKGYYCKCNLTKLHKKGAAMKQICLNEIVTFTAGKNSSRVNVPTNEIYTQDDFTSDLHCMENTDKKADCIINLIRTKASMLSDKTEKKCITSNFILCTFDMNVLDPWFFCYQINEGRDVEQQIVMFHQGNTLSVKKLNIKSIGDLKIELSSIEKQRLVGSIYKQSIIQRDLMNRQIENIKELTMETIRKITED